LLGWFAYGGSQRLQLDRHKQNACASEGLAYLPAFGKKSDKFFVQKSYSFIRKTIFATYEMHCILFRAYAVGILWQNAPRGGRIRA
jgi:hypothetical protein